MNPKIQCKKTICFIIVWLLLMQGLLLGMKQIVFCFVNETLDTRSMTTMVSMMILFVIIFLYCQRSRRIMSVFSTKFSSGYIIITVIAVIFYVLTLFFVKKLSIQNFRIGECSDMPCQKLRDLFDDPEHGERGARLYNLKNWKDGIYLEVYNEQ
ncbi:MAG: hypothetical protein HFI70_02995 [Lachnospiraceae bacterium]|nr:hypothetical protein [Lachnospiraceae bacterium]